MDVFYHSIIALCILAASPYLALRCALQPGFRDDLLQRLRGGAELPRLHNSLWIHASSVGEVKVARVLIEALSQRFPERNIVLSTFTPMGYETAQREIRHPVFRLPPDFPFWIHPLIKRIDPDALILIEAEFWPCLLRRCLHKQIPVVLVNGRMSERSFLRYSRFLPVFDWLTEAIMKFSMRSETDLERVARLNVNEKRRTLAGNMKFDRIQGPSAVPVEPDAESIPRIVFGSTRPGDEAIALDAIQAVVETFPETQWVIAPRHLHRCDEVEQMIRKRDLEYVLFSGIADDPWGYKGTLVLIDRMGELNRYYAHCQIAVVGGGFDPDQGGQNILEPAGWGRTVIFGPHMTNFEEEARKLVDSGGGIQLESPEELAPNLIRLLGDPQERLSRGEVARETLNRNRGALARNLELIESVLGS